MEIGDSMKITIYHGSEFIIKFPEFKKGKPNNDYGYGFYCTEHLSLAQEWACSEAHGGYANQYSLDLAGLKILNLNDENYSILHWLALLLKNRNFYLENEIGNLAKEYILKNYLINTSTYDVIIGYRADDSYFSFARDFLHNIISIQKLKEAMHLGNLGNQIVLISPKAFEKIKFKKAIKAEQYIFYKLRKERDDNARQKYLESRNNISSIMDEVFIIDIIRGGNKHDY